MRTHLWLAGVAVALAAAGSASAQQALTWGPVAGPLVFQVANTNASAVPISGPMLVDNKFSLSSIFARVGNITNGHIFGDSAFPTQGQLPGKDYLKAFGFQRPPRIQ
jgi:hypothetical protein